MAAFWPSMLTQEQAVEIRVMARRGEEIREIARQLGCSRNTVRRYLREEEARRYGPRSPRATKLDPYRAYLAERVEQARPRWIPATVLLREIAERGYDGGISQLKAWLAPLKQGTPDPVVRFETPPGQQMQADFTWVRKGRDPLVAFVATLGYSRATYVKFGRSEDLEALRTGLREAFGFFGGVPEHVLFDNPKTVVIDREAYGGACTAGTKACGAGRGTRLQAAPLPAVSGQDQGWVRFQSALTRSGANEGAQDFGV
jgi:transposase